MIRRWFARLFSRKKKKEEEAITEEVLALLGDGGEYVGYTMMDARTGMMLSVLMVCGCGSPVQHRGEDGGSFACEHCDSPCDIRPCDLCTTHFLFDAEAIRAEFRENQDPDSEEEEE